MISHWVGGLFVKYKCDQYTWDRMLIKIMFFHCGMQYDKQTVGLQIRWVIWKWVSLPWSSCCLVLTDQVPVDRQWVQRFRYTHTNIWKEEYIELFWEPRSWGLTQWWPYITIWTSVVGFSCYRINCLVGVACCVFPEVSSKIIWREALSGQLEESGNKWRKWLFLCAIKGEAEHVRRALQLPARTPLTHALFLFLLSIQTSLTNEIVSNEIVQQGWLPGYL